MPTLPSGEHKVKRALRSSLEVETAAAHEALERADLIRMRLIEVHSPFDLKKASQELKAVKVFHQTDCKSLYDLIHARGATPTDKRLVIDLRILRDDLQDGQFKTKWTNTLQMCSDSLTKQNPRAADYLRYVMKTNRLSLAYVPALQKILDKERQQEKDERKAHYDAKSVERMVLLAELARTNSAQKSHLLTNLQQNLRGVWKQEGDVSVETVAGGYRHRLPTGKNRFWRWTVIQTNVFGE